MGSIRQGLASNEKEDRKKEPIANEAMVIATIYMSKVAKCNNNFILYFSFFFLLRMTRKDPPIRVSVLVWQKWTELSGVLALI